ncbi:PH domain-containing protein [Streptomyces avicenniae]|uniref:PH domain-containing protein n=1 Tax=Streptomyces avicenniae TaxID=500153 RepID=UPI000699F5A2|nr:PH domain-containing protein [Streptomyces avicenniae]
MTAEAGAASLGGVVSEHPTDSGRCARVAAVALAVGVLGVAAGVPLLVWWFGADDVSGPNTVAGAPLGIGLLALCYGVPRAVRARRTRGEVFVLHERGVVWRRPGGERAVPWAEITSVEQSGRQQAAARAVGADVHCRVRFRDGGGLLVTGFTRDAAELARRLERGATGRQTW